MCLDTLVVGAGQAGLATGYRLQRAGHRFLMLEAGDAPGGSWPYYYDSLSLNSPARYSSLPGLAFPGDPDAYPPRDDVVAYLRDYAEHFRLPIRTGTRVARIERDGQLFRVVTGSDDVYLARTIVAATGFFERPYLPEIRGRAVYRGRVLHVADYRSPEPFRGQRLVVVGGGNAAVQIGVELAKVADVTLATRNPVRTLPQHVLGRDIHFWLGLIGLDQTQWMSGKSTPVYLSERYRAALAAGRPDQRPMFEQFTDDGVVWADGSREAVDAVIFATGYRPALGYLAGLGALDEGGQAIQRGGGSTAVPGLFYVGLVRERNFASATLRGAAADSAVVVEAIGRYLEPARRADGRRQRSFGWEIGGGAA